MEFFFRFALISYAAIFFFVMGWRLSIFERFNLDVFKNLLFFAAIAAPLSFTLSKETMPNRVLVSLIWTSIINLGFRFGKKVTRPSAQKTV